MKRKQQNEERLEDQITKRLDALIRLFIEMNKSGDKKEKIKFI